MRLAAVTAVLLDEPDDPDEPTPERWQPDEGVVPAYLAGGGKPMRDLLLADRCWVVASLTHAGCTADYIRQRMDCSLRLVRTVRAEPMTAVCLMYLTEAAVFADELRLSRQDRRSIEENTVAMEAKLSRVTAERDRLIAKMRPVVFAKCQHPRDRYNTWTSPSTGKQSCRTCHRDREKERRACSPVSVPQPGAECLGEVVESAGPELEREQGLQEDRLVDETRT